MTALAWWLVQHQPVFLNFFLKWAQSDQFQYWNGRLGWFGGIHEYPHDSVLISKGLNFRTVLNNCDTLRLKLARVGIPGCAPGIRWLTLGEHVFLRDMRSRGWQHHERLLKSTYPGWWFGTWLLFFHLLGIIIPSDQLIFFRGVGLNHQPVSIHIR